MKLYHKKKVQILHAYCICIEPLRWGWGGSWKSACHVTQRKCDGVLFSGNCSEEVVSSFSCGFIKSYLALIPIRTAFIWGRSGNCASHVTQRKCDGVLFSGNCSEGIVSSFPCGFIKIYLALIPIRTAFIWSYIIKKKLSNLAGKCASHVTQRKCNGVLFSGNN